MFLLDILLVLSFGILIEAGVKSFCNITSAKEGEEALISCRFDTDINTFQKDVLVFKVKETPVLILAWYDGKPNINTEPGYEFDGRISDVIIIKIPKAHPDHAGEYKCIVPPSAKGDTQGCSLYISGTNNDSLLTPFLTFPTTTLADDKATSLVPKSTSTIYADTKGTNTETIIAIILGVALGLVIILLVVVALRKRQTFIRIQKYQHNGA